MWLWPSAARLTPRFWEASLIVTGAPVAWRTLRGVAAGRFAADLVASFAIIGAALLQQPLAGLVVVVMQTGGEALERYAEGRASAAVRELEADAPRIAHRVRDGETEDIPVSDVAVGDELLVRPGEMIPCDAVVVSGRSHIDTSRITGEPLPVPAMPGAHLLSGTVNGDALLTIRTLAVAGESQYARIVELVRSAQASKAPLQRVADRYAVWFTPFTLAACAVTYFLSGDVVRVLAVLVVATPCPLILATPVAILGGINRAARRQIVIRTGSALEQLSAVTIAVFDKTGTLTIGRPAVRRVMPRDGLSEHDALQLAAAVELGSSHQLARTVVDAARAATLEIPVPDWVREDAGRGVLGEVGGRVVAVGSRRFIGEQVDAGSNVPSESAAGLRAYVAVDGVFVATIEFADAMRPEVGRSLAELSRLGVHRILIVSGDHQTNARAVGDLAGIAEVHGDLLPEHKVNIVRDLVAQGETVMMVGDGTNDAPALSAASVGVALAAHGGGIVAEAGDVIMLADDLTRVSEAVQIGRRTMWIARQSIWVGLGLSGVAMVAAAFGALAPVPGAVLQEVIDLAVIVNALRASR
jgi:heavy metal translocating P-type ATPase